MDRLKNDSRSKALAKRVLYRVMEVLAESDGFLTRREIVDTVGETLELSEWEAAKTNKAQRPRWKNALWYTTDAVKAGFIQKARGKWRITPEGRKALSLGPDGLLAAAIQGYREWAENRDDNDNGASSSALGLRGQIMRLGMTALSQAPDRQLSRDQLLQRVRRGLPEDTIEALEARDVDWMGGYTSRAFYTASKANWIDRNAGTWTLTEAGLHALNEWPNPSELAAKAKQAAGRGGGHEKLPYLGHVTSYANAPQSLYQSHSATIGQLVGEIQQGTLALPDIQRPFVWKNTKVRDLLDSMFRGFPFGFLLTWKSPDTVNSHAMGVGNDATIMPHALVIDGQQRLTSLYAVMTGSPVVDSEFRERRIRIAFHPIRGTFSVADAAIDRDPEWLSDVSSVFTESMGALAVVRKYIERLEAAREIDDSHRTVAEQNISRLVNLRNIPVSVLQITTNADEEQVAEIFVRINSRGQNLKQADFILTLLAVFWQEGRENLEDFARNCLQPSAGTGPSPFNRRLHPGPDDLVRVAVAVGHRRARLSAAYQILRGKDPQTGEITSDTRSKNIGLLEAAQSQVLDVNNWHEFMKVLSAAGYRHKKLLQSEITALYAYALFLIGRESLGISLTELRRVIGRWFMMSTITGRYVGGSSESAMEEDLSRLREVTSGEQFIEVLEHAMAAELTNDFWTVTLPSRLESSATRSLSSFFAAQSVLGANALYSSLTVAELFDSEKQSTKEDLEIHHVFPKAWLKKQGVRNQKDINQIANMALLEWHANIDVSDEDPASYAPRLEKRAQESGLNVAEMYRLHALPEGWPAMDYFEFLGHRRRAIAGLIREAFGRIA